MASVVFLDFPIYFCSNFDETSVFFASVISQRLSRAFQYGDPHDSMVFTYQKLYFHVSRFCDFSEGGKNCQKSEQNRSPEKTSKVDAPGTRFGTQNRRALMPERQKSTNLQNKRFFFEVPVFVHFFACEKKHEKVEKKRDDGGRRGRRAECAGSVGGKEGKPSRGFALLRFSWWNLFRMSITPAGVRRMTESAQQRD